jgi:hypothetical protein
VQSRDTWWGEGEEEDNGDGILLMDFKYLYEAELNNLLQLL